MVVQGSERELADVREGHCGSQKASATWKAGAAGGEGGGSSFLNAAECWRIDLRMRLCGGHW